MALASFKIGSRELFIPDVNIALLRSPGLPSNNAKFHVPLWFSKLDLRDYLFHAYGVEILSVRSYVKQSRVQSGQPNLIRPAIRRWHRPRANKFMTVELARPFVWPEEPEDGYQEWNRKDVKNSDEEQEKFQESLGSVKDTIVDEERRERMREQAKALLEGKAKWKAPEGRFTKGFSRGQ
ncbi:Putative ribosomal protein L25/L23 [Septoria linicola]|uniref:Large ribosomal subunit protein uL23m n=1 Tax=Septoria linicola TaxID=215465 RepID=A0A9Q9EMH5_9PEZI|nr:putative ribosomal protein L25/L23 [Septoria linicola]USW56821.1 Putative ribosomal protein L25/L23 [Septoria linicola]